ncbi:amidase [Streptomyces sp. ISID311]|uniref:amidase n=1 Tax=Streptomyces sp. ISID311 TaxID=2601673 RepID=UPI0011BD3B77|nr:amidase [Streptomyces sp. ISID311]TXC96215.1 amidase [Streptomyces sp. ISID311]
MSRLIQPSARETVAALRAGMTTCEEVVHSALQASRRAHAETNAFVEIDAEGALAAARELDRRGPDFGLMGGVPYAFKDMFARRGQRAGLGTTGTRLRTRAADSTCLDRLDQAGAIPLGRLNLDPYGYAATGLNPYLGAVRNPCHSAHIAGGSSSGAAAAVAAGAIPFAVGSDTAGSVRIPAALCGVVGFKPTYGRIPRTGAIPLSYSQDTVGIIARTVDDVALALSVMSGQDRQDPTSFDAPPPPPPDAEPTVYSLSRGLRIGVDHDYLREHCDDAVFDALMRSCALLEELGARLVPVSLAELPRYDLAASVLTWCEAGAVHGYELAHDPHLYPASLHQRFHQALAAHGTDHVNALRIQGVALRAFLSTVLASCDTILSCGAPIEAPRIDDAEADPVLTTLRLLSMNRPFNFLGLPSITLPMGTGPGHLPLGLQLVARPWAEHVLLRTAAAYEQHAAAAGPSRSVPTPAPERQHHECTTGLPTDAPSDAC